MAVAAASGAMAVTMPAYAGGAADGAAAGSPGLISGNTVQLPVHVPVNVCGNTVDVVGLLNPAAGNTCVNADSGGHGRPASRGAAGRGAEGHGATRGHGHGTSPGGGTASSAGANAEGAGKDSPGLLSGNALELPVQLPVNVSGNSVNVVGIGNASVGNESVNTPGDRPDTPGRPTRPTPSTPPKHHPGPKPPAYTPPAAGPALAHTGADQTVPAAIGSAALVLGGAAVYRRFRPRGTR
ncbi:chaplin [Streptomyces sp. SID13726]|nr:chaplin [Streptomyces sp. SID13726]